MLLRDRLRAELEVMGTSPDYVRLVAEVLGIRNAPAALAKRLVEQALVVEDRREAWLRIGERICADAPAVPGVYRLVDADRRVLYVGKANNLRRRLRSHFAVRRWRHVTPAFARATAAEWQEVGSEIEALLREAAWIRAFAPTVNVQTSAPVLETRAVPAALVKDTLLLLPSAFEEHVILLGARVDGRVLLLDAGRDGRGLTDRAALLRRFFATAPDAGVMPGDEDSFEGLSPLVFTWLAGRGASATRIDPHDVPSARELKRRIEVLLGDRDLFAERLVVIRSGR